MIAGIIEELIKKRKLSGLTQTELAAKLDIGDRTYQEIELKKEVNKTSDLRSILNYLGFDMKFFASSQEVNSTWRDHLRSLSPSDIPEALEVLADVARKTVSKKPGQLSKEPDTSKSKAAKKFAGNGKKPKKGTSDTD